MKLIAIIALLTATLVTPALAQDQQGEVVKPHPATEAKSLVGTNAVIVGKVAEVNQTEKIIRVNFEEKFPKQVFTAVIFPASFPLFTNASSWEGKTLEVSGKVVEFRGHPQIVVASKGQLRVVEGAPKADAGASPAGGAK